MFTFSNCNPLYRFHFLKTSAKWLLLQQAHSFDLFTTTKLVYDTQQFSVYFSHFRNSSFVQHINITWLRRANVRLNTKNVDGFRWPLNVSNIPDHESYKISFKIHIEPRHVSTVPLYSFPRCLALQSCFGNFWQLLTQTHYFSLKLWPNEDKSRYDFVVSLV